MEQREMIPNQSKKAVWYKRMFLISTVSGVLGIYVLYKGFSAVLAWILLGIWAVLAVTVRVLIMRDKKFLKDKKI